MLSRLKEVEKRYEELMARLCDPAVVSQAELYRSLMKESSELEPLVTAYRAYETARAQEREARELLDGGGLDRELRELAEEELAEGRANAERLAEELKILLLPKDPSDGRNVVLEIRAGAGGEESALFAADLLRMYTLYAQTCGYQTEIVGANETELGGYKEISCMITGQGAYSRLKFESGVHRVQRVPETETSGRDWRAYPHVHGDGSRASRSGRGGTDDRAYRFADRHLPLQRCGRSAYQQNGIRYPHHPLADGYGGGMPG